MSSDFLFYPESVAFFCLIFFAFGIIIGWLFGYTDTDKDPDDLFPKVHKKIVGSNVHPPYKIVKPSIPPNPPSICCGGNHQFKDHPQPTKGIEVG